MLLKEWGFITLKILIPKDKDFFRYKNEVKKLYLENQDKINDDNTFDFICKETFFYLFLVDEKILGVIYFFQDDGKLYLNGFAVRKFLKEKLEALKLATTWFNCEIYAEAQNKASAYCLKKVGFKKITERLYAYYPQFFPT